MSNDLVKEARGWKAGSSDDSQRMVWLMNKLCDVIEKLEIDVSRLEISRWQWQDEAMKLESLRMSDLTELSVLRDALKFVDYHISRDNVEAKERIREVLGGLKSAGVTIRKDVSDGETQVAANPEPATPADPFKLTDADRKHILFKHYGIGTCDCPSCKPKEAVPGGTACQSSEQAVPETTTNDAHRD